MTEFGKTLEFNEFLLENSLFTTGNVGGYAWCEEHDCWLSFNDNTKLYVCECDWSNHIGMGDTKEKAFKNWLELNKD